MSVFLHYVLMSARLTDDPFQNAVVHHYHKSQRLLPQTSSIHLPPSNFIYALNYHTLFTHTLLISQTHSAHTRFKNPLIIRELLV